MDKNALSEQYDNFADAFSKAITEKNRINRKAFYNQIDFPLREKTILDLACGDGSDIVYYESLGAKVYGIDASEELIKLARTKAPSANIQVGFIEKLPYQENMFDVVLSKYAIQTLTDMSPVFDEVARVLKSGGTFMYLVTHPTRQFLEKRKFGKDYFKQEIVKSVLFDGRVTVEEPTHTFNEYLSPAFLKQFDIIGFEETYDPLSAEQVDNDIYPGFFILKTKKRA